MLVTTQINFQFLWEPNRDHHQVAEKGGPEYCGSDSNNSKPGAITKWTVTL